MLHVVRFASMTKHTHAGDPATSPSPKLTTREVVDSRMLMNMIGAGGRDTARRIAESVEKPKSGYDPKSEHDPVYDVRVSINGIDLDFRDFAAEIQRQLNTLILDRATKLLDQVIGDRIGQLIEQTTASIQDLNLGIQRKAAELPGESVAHPEGVPG